MSAPRQVCQVGLRKGLSEKILPILALADPAILLTYSSTPMFSFTSQWAGRWKAKGFSDNILHLYHQYLPGGNNCISLQHCIFTLHSFSMKSRCVTHISRTQLSSIQPWQARAHIKLTVHHLLRECISKTRTWLQLQPTAGFPQMEGQSLHSAVLI